MKKWLVFFLLLITATATLLPCFNKDCCCNDEFASGTANHNNHKSEGSCSPFITCASCHGFAQMTSLTDVPVLREEKPIHHSKVISNSLSYYAASHFQPPRLV